MRPLHIAAEKGNAEMVRLLIDAKCNIHVRALSARPCVHKLFRSLFQACPWQCAEVTRGLELRIRHGGGSPGLLTGQEGHVAHGRRGGEAGSNAARSAG
jgi:ankyrin repeat protein